MPAHRIRLEAFELRGEGADERALHGDVEGAALEDGVGGQVDGFGHGLCADDTAGGRGFGGDIEGDGDLLHDGIGEPAAALRGEGELGRTLRDDRGGPFDHRGLARGDLRLPGEGALHLDALGLEGDRHIRRLLRGIAHEEAKGRVVAHTEEARKGRPQEQRLRRDELVRPLSDERVAADGAGLEAPGSEVVGHLHIDREGAVVLRDELGRPVGGVLELLAKAVILEAATALAALPRLGDDVVRAVH